MSKNVDETVRLQSEIRRGWIREIRGERLQGISEGASSAPRLASSSTMLFPRRNKCPETHCSLIEQEEREDSSCQICHRVWDKRKDGGKDKAARTERESDRRRRKEKWQTCWCCLDQERVCRMAQASVEKLEHTGPAEKGKSGLSTIGRAVGKYAGAALAKRKWSRAVCPKHQIMKGRESRWARAAIWRVRGGSEREHGVERVDSTVNEGRFQGGNGDQARRASLEQVEGSISR